MVRGIYFQKKIVFSKPNFPPGDPRIMSIPNYKKKFRSKAKISTGSEESIKL